MYAALKETLLQVFIAYLPAFSCQIYTMKPERISKAHYNIGFFSSLSVLLCMMLSFYYFKATVQPFDFRLIPYTLGILYGGYLMGSFIVGFYILVLIGFSFADYPVAMWSDALIYLTPFLFLYISKFRQAGTRKRVYIVMSFAVLGILLYFVYYVIALWNHTIIFDMEVLLFMTIFGAVFLGAAGLVVYFVESAREKAYLQQGYISVWRQYRQEAHKLHQVIDAPPLGVISVDANERITGINQMMLSMLFREDNMPQGNHLIGREYHSVIQTTRFWRGQELLVHRVLRGESLQSDVITVEDRTYLIRAASMKNQETGEIVGAVAMMHDITELVQLRAEMGNMERLSLVGQMAASITHEIRNPMAVVRGFIQLMKQKSPDHLDDYYKIVMEELDRANSIINDFLSLAQNRIVEKERIHLHDLINTISPLLQADANLRGQEIMLKLQECVPELLLNPKEIKQLLLNLARNAMEAMDEKGSLIIETRYEGQGVDLIVKDNGPGIPKATLDKLFEPFFTTKTKGTGLGLPLCLSIVERHNGTIRVESEEGQGTTFIVSFRTEDTLQTMLQPQAI
ncbi:two-component system sensor histidine kinase NtrB [Paenibacillus aquistagni]|uniref:two-component system sensor histidine kinase NtrB n=1 Tax=Paenibacillus aquistagni TaxID=1852522 RepID=UPI000B503FB5|nr:ATP-binding protein [Paenibacillus aquistagni]